MTNSHKNPRPWMTTAALLVVNLALVGVIVGSPVPVQAQRPPPTICQPCYQGDIRGLGSVHATSEFEHFWGTARMYGAYTTSHAPRTFYPGDCLTYRHYGVMCCLLD